jgi:flavin reductase (DIM6/NTAB) family NADH-FMN oxidoreductase RutF
VTASPSEAILPAVDERTFRMLAGSFPSGVCVVTVRAADGTPKGLTTQSFVGLSLEPPLISIAVGRTSRTLEALRRSEQFVVNILRKDAAWVATRFASKDDDKFRDIVWTQDRPGPPVFKDVSVAAMTCATQSVIGAGDHWIIIGLVLGGVVFGGEPLLYYRQRYGEFTST